jgi:5-methylcytosine-specific restriction endonuclease McrA
MAKKKRKPPTKSSKAMVVSWLRKYWLRSPERSNALKKADRSCEICGVKHSRAKGREVTVVVHHKSGIDNWGLIYDLIMEQLLNEDDLQALCKEHHDKEHDKGG